MLQPESVQRPKWSMKKEEGVRGRGMRGQGEGGGGEAGGEGGKQRYAIFFV